MIDNDAPSTPAQNAPPETGDRTLGVAAGVLAVLAITIAASLMAFPSLRHAPLEIAELSILNRRVKPPMPDLGVLMVSIDRRWRGGRFDAAFFDDLADQVESARTRLPASPDLELLTDWTAGAQALTADNPNGAKESLAKVMGNPSFRSWIQLLPGRFVGYREATAETFHSWRLSIFWGDPLGQAGAQIQKQIDIHGEQRTLLFGQALISHLDGDHARAAAQAAELEADFSNSPQGAHLLARFVGDQYLWSGDLESALSWYEKLDSSTSQAEIAAVVRTLELEGGTSFLEQACAGGFPPACEP